MKGTHYGLLKPSSSRLYSLLSRCGFFCTRATRSNWQYQWESYIQKKGLASILVIAIDTNYSDGEERSHNRALTDIDGNYLINNVPTGDYLVYPVAPELVVESDQRVTITAGETIRDINFALVHSGAITGRITGADGQPLGLTVSVVRVEPESVYERHKFASFRADDRGIYQAFGLRPGKYKVSVGQPLPQQLPLPGFVQKIFRQTFYPSATDPEKATILEVTESSEIKDIDIVASAASTFKLTGRIIDGETSKPTSQRPPCRPAKQLF